MDNKASAQQAMDKAVAAREDGSIPVTSASWEYHGGTLMPFPWRPGTDEIRQRIDELGA